MRKYPRRKRRRGTQANQLGGLPRGRPNCRGKYLSLLLSASGRPFFVGARSCDPVLRSTNVHPASAQLLVCRTVTHGDSAFDLDALRERLSDVSGSIVFHALILFRRRRLVRDMSSNDNSRGCYVYRGRKRYRRRRTRYRFCYRVYRGACYLGRSLVPRVSLPGNFATQGIGCVMGNVYTGYTTGRSIWNHFFSLRRWGARGSGFRIVGRVFCSGGPCLYDMVGGRDSAIAEGGSYCEVWGSYFCLIKVAACF